MLVTKFYLEEFVHPIVINVRFPLYPVSESECFLAGQNFRTIGYSSNECLTSPQMGTGRDKRIAYRKAIFIIDALQ